jgi:hypothetical protein
VSARTALLTVAFILALAGVASAAVLTVDADEMTLVRVPGAVPPKTCTVGAVADTDADEALPDAGDGTATTVGVAAGPAAAKRAFVRFDLAPCSIPSNAEVRSAALRMVLAAAPAADRTWKVRRVAEAWSEATMTWNTMPTTFAAVSTDTLSTGTVAGATLAWNVAADVANIVSGAVTDNGWRIADADEASPTPDGGALAARENAAADDRPALTVTWFD